MGMFSAPSAPAAPEPIKVAPTPIAPVYEDVPGETARRKVDDAKMRARKVNVKNSMLNEDYSSRSLLGG